MEKRKYARTSTRLSVSVSLAGTVVDGTLLDVSSEGAFVGFSGASVPVAQVGDQLQFTLVAAPELGAFAGRIEHVGVDGAGIALEPMAADVANRVLELALTRAKADSPLDVNKAFPAEARRHVRDACIATAAQFFRTHLARGVDEFVTFYSGLTEDAGAGVSSFVSRETVAAVMSSRDVFVSSVIQQMIALITQGLPLETVVDKVPVLIPDAGFSSETLSLVDKDDFEDWLKAKVAVSKVEGFLKESMTELETRLEFLYFRGADKVDNPFSPTSFCQVVHSRIRSVGLHRGVERLYYKRLIDHVVGQYDNLFTALNEHFIDAGVLPPGDIGRYLVKRLARLQAAEKRMRPVVEREPERADGSNVSVASETSAGDDVSSDGTQGVAGPVASVGIASGFSAANDLVRIQRELLGNTVNLDETDQNLTVITEAQLRSMLAQLAREDDTLELAAQSGAEGALSSAIAQKLASQQVRFSAATRDSIDIMASLVTTIAEQQKMSDEAKKQFCRVQIPLAALQLADPELFQSESNPGRELINYLAMLAEPTSMNPASNIDTIRRSVDYLSSHDMTDSSVLSAVLADVRQHVDKEKRIIDRNITRVIEICEGQQRVTQANTQLEDEVGKRVSGRSVSRLLLEFLDCGWRELMRLTLIREGRESRAWQTALSVLDDVVAISSVRPLVVSALTFPTDDLFKIIEKGLQKVPSQKLDQKAVVEALRQCVDRETIPDDSMVFVEAPAPVSTVDGPIQDKWLKRAHRMAQGQWVEFGTVSGVERLCQLIWVAEDKSRFTFVSQQGLKIADLTDAEVATRLDSGDIVPLGDGSDTAIEKGFDALIQRLYAKVARDVSRDQLTGLVNRKEFEHSLAQSVARARSQNVVFALVYIDISGFKIINSTCGYDGGDALLRETAQLITDLAPQANVAARLGGNEFAVISEVENDGIAFKLAMTLKSGIEARRFKWKNQHFSISVGVAVTTYDNTVSQVLELLNTAESGVQMAKSRGQKDIQWIKPGDSRLEYRSQIMSWVGRITSALDNGRLRLRCQKIAPVKEIHPTLKPHFEILLAVIDESGEQIPPGDFIKAAEEYGQMALVDRWVITETLRWVDQHRDFMDTIGGFTVNVSGHSLNNERFLDFVFELLVLFDVPRDKLLFEVTETTAVANLEQAGDFIAQMREIGCRFSLDDFGSGQSSYAYLKHLPVDIIKIDGTFIKSIESSPLDYALVKSITDMGHFLKKKIVAEFVSDQAKYDICQQLGVDYVQGFHIAKPIPLDSLIEQESGVLS